MNVLKSEKRAEVERLPDPAGDRFDFCGPADYLEEAVRAAVGA